ncbi:hypothetical protein [Streptomyces sp. NPDC058308]|uniref:hypothetical protein n=1 Tax=Streptomyces sp. NPDC058308 TaxID=3346440 RepID=UPI0036E936E9
MADEQHKWLDRDTAERLLRGEPLEGIDPGARAQADRLAQALAALAEQDRGAAPERAATDLPAGTETGAVAGAAGHRPGPLSGELPGEAAALAAFRAARAELPQDVGSRSRTAPYASAAHRDAAGETVRLGRAGNRPGPSRWGRPVRFGIAAALAACMIGGVAVAAGTGVLPSPFGTHADPGPAVSATSAATPEEPSAAPSDDEREPSEDLAPDESTAPDDEPTRKPQDGPPSEAEADDGPTGAPRQPDSAAPPHRDEAKGWYRKAVAACRAYRSGELDGDKRRRLEEAARGPARVEEFCGRVLGGRPGGGHQGGGRGGGDHGGSHGGEGGDGENGGDEGGSSGGDSGGAPGPPMSSPSVPRTTPTAPTGSYSPLPHLP